MEKDEVMLKLGQNLMVLRRGRGFTQVELAEGAAVHHTYVGHIESGAKMPGTFTMLKLCRALKCTPELLLKGIR